MPDSYRMQTKPAQTSDRNSDKELGRLISIAWEKRINLHFVELDRSLEAIHAALAPPFPTLESCPPEVLWEVSRGAVAAQVCLLVASRIRGHGELA